VRALAECLAPLGIVDVVAPSAERSGSAQALSVRQACFLGAVAEHEWSVEGTPTARSSWPFAISFRSLPTSWYPVSIAGNMGETSTTQERWARARSRIHGIPFAGGSVAIVGSDFNYEVAGAMRARVGGIFAARWLAHGVLLM